MTETLEVDDLRFNVTRSTRRTTAAVLIERDGSLQIQAPADLGADVLSEAARSRLEWVHRKLAERLLRARIPRKEFVGGETFRYLGRTYRLAYVDDEATVGLRGGRIEVPEEQRGDAEAGLRRWYTAHAREWIGRRLAEWCHRMPEAPATVRVRDLGYRWASLSDDGSLNVHWQAVSLPPSVIDYLIAHELTHLQHPHHDRAFWTALLRLMPDAETRRDWLRSHGEGW